MLRINLTPNHMRALYWDPVMSYSCVSTQISLVHYMMFESIYSTFIIVYKFADSKLIAIALQINSNELAT